MTATPTPPTIARAVVFDLDGLMFDTEALFHRVAADFLAARGRPFSIDIMRAMMGRRAVEGLALFKQMSGVEDTIEAIRDELRDRFYAEVDTAVHPTPGLFALLSAIEDRKLPHAVATSSGREYAERLLGSHGLLDHFDFLLTAEDVTRGKPEPEVYLKAIERFGLPAASVLVLEDSPAGITAAKSAGAFAVAVPHDHSPPEGLSHADLIVPRLDDPAVLSRLG